MISRVMAHGRTTHVRWRGWLALSPGPLGVAVLLLAAADLGSRLADDTLIPVLPLDDVAHLLTGLLVIWALSSSAGERFLLPVLIASVAIDLDHIPARLGIYYLTEGTPRPYTHSLLTIVVLIAISVLWHRRRDLLLGLAIGLAIHFWRDMGEGDSGVALLWPLSNHSFQYPHGAYVAVIASVVLIAALRCALQSRTTDRLGRWKSSTRRHSEAPENT